MISISPRGEGLHGAGDLGDAGVVDVEARHRPVRARVRRLLLDGQRAAVLGQLHDAEPLRVAHLLSEDGGARLPGGGPRQELGHARALEEVVAQD